LLSQVPVLQPVKFWLALNVP